MDLISVIVPVYKVEQYLDRCVESIVNQTYRNLEIILVDDGSPDNCPVMCDLWAKKDSRIKVIHKKNGGLSDARNAGLRNANGNYIAFVDSDDWIALNMYDVLFKAMKENKSDISSCGVKKVWKEQKDEIITDNYSAIILDKIEALNELIDDNLIQQIVWNKLYCRAVVDGILFEKGKHHEDEYWSYQVFGRANKTVVVSIDGYYYFQRGNSIMSEKYSLKRLDAVEAKVQRQEYFDKHYQCLSKKAQINLLFTCLFHGQLAIKYLSKREQKKAFHILRTVVSRYAITNAELDLVSPTQKMWMLMANKILYFTCWLRNLLNIGF